MATEINDHEQYFEWYLDELEAHGFIERYDREPETLLVVPPYIHQREKHLKKSENKIEDFALLSAMEYTYDYRIIWKDKAINIFTEIFDPEKPFKFGQPHFISHWMMLEGFHNLVSYVDVKPHFKAAQYNQGMSSFYTFPFIQKILLFTRSIYVNKVIPINSGRHGVNTCLFAKTFTPNRYLFTDKASMKRKIKFRTVTISSYHKRMQNIVEQYEENEKAKQGEVGQQKLL